MIRSIAMRQWVSSPASEQDRLKDCGDAQTRLEQDRLKRLLFFRMSDATPKLQYLPCGGVVSTAFVFQTVSIQNAANSVYVAKSTIDGEYAASNSDRVYTFKSDRERMQYILGRQGSAPRCTGY